MRRRRPSPGRRACLPILIMGIGLVTSVRATPQTTYQDFSELDLESLLDQTVITASKHEQKLSESPVATTVITAEDIARSGALSIPEVLLGVPGLDVIVSSASGYDVSARGMAELGANDMLVLVDGRSVYADFYGLPLWERLQVAMEEIEAIEIILGPGSAFYGANAFSGVINIITYDPEEIPGTTVSLGGSDQGGSRATFIHAGTDEKLGWKVSGGYEGIRDWELERAQQDMIRLDGRLRVGLDDVSALTFSGGLSDGLNRLVPASVPMDVDGRTSYQRVDYERDDLTVRWYRNAWKYDISPLYVDPVILISALDAETHDIEFQHALHPGDRNLLLWGGSYRYKRMDWTMQRSTQSQDIYSAFVYDEWRPADAWQFSLGVRYDDHPLVGGHVAPRGGLVYRPHRNHTLRAAYGEAYRDPTSLENHMWIDLALPGGMTQLVRGDEGLESEKIRSLEFGYSGLLGNDVMLTANIFRNEMRGLIDMRILGFLDSPPFPVPNVPSELAFQNDDAWNSTGGELSLAWQPSERLRIRGSWAYLWLEDDETGERVASSVRDHVNGGLTYLAGRGHVIGLDTRYRSMTEWSTTQFTGEDLTGIGEERVVVDLSWHWDEAVPGLTATVAARNLLDRRYRDHPLTIEHRRQIVSTVSVRF